VFTQGLNFQSPCIKYLFSNPIPRCQSMIYVETSKLFCRYLYWRRTLSRPLFIPITRLILESFDHTPNFGKESNIFNFKPTGGRLSDACMGQRKLFTWFFSSVPQASSLEKLLTPVLEHVSLEGYHSETIRDRDEDAISWSTVLSLSNRTGGVPRNTPYTSSSAWKESQSTVIHQSMGRTNFLGSILKQLS
jgi:hypothetical protein